MASTSVRWPFRRVRRPANRITWRRSFSRSPQAALTVATRAAAAGLQVGFQAPAVRGHERASTSLGDGRGKVQGRLLHASAVESRRDLKQGETFGKNGGLDARGSGG